MPASGSKELLPWLEAAGRVPALPVPPWRRAGADPDSPWRCASRSSSYSSAGKSPSGRTRQYSAPLFPSTRSTRPTWKSSARANTGMAIAERRLNRLCPMLILGGELALRGLPWGRESFGEGFGATFLQSGQNYVH